MPAYAPAAAASGAALPWKPPPGCLSKSVLTLLIATLTVALSSLRRVAALPIHLCLEGHESPHGCLRGRRDRPTASATMTDRRPASSSSMLTHVNFIGTVAVDMGSGLSKALHAECEPPEAIQTIRGYTDQIAWLWTCLPESARAHAPFSRCTLSPAAFLDRTIQTGQLPAGRTHMPATPGGSRTPIRIGQMEHIHLPFLHARELASASLHPASADKDDREDDTDDCRAAADDAKTMRDIRKRHPAQIDVHAIKS